MRQSITKKARAFRAAFFETKSFRRESGGFAFAAGAHAESAAAITPKSAMVDGSEPHQLRWPRQCFRRRNHNPSIS